MKPSVIKIILMNFVKLLMNLSELQCHVLLCGVCVLKRMQLTARRVVMAEFMRLKLYASIQNPTCQAHTRKTQSSTAEA